MCIRDSGHSAHLEQYITGDSGVYASGQKKSDMVKQGEQKRVQDRVVVTERDQAGSLGKLADAVQMCIRDRCMEFRQKSSNRLFRSF